MRLLENTLEKDRHIFLHFVFEVADTEEELVKAGEDKNSDDGSEWFVRKWDDLSHSEKAALSNFGKGKTTDQKKRMWMQWGANDLYPCYRNVFDEMLKEYFSS